jgi:hypothetical protein
MTRKKAKEVTLEVWRYLADHPSIADKSGIPRELYDKVAGLRAACPLCALFDADRVKGCQGCPLEAEGEWCKRLGSAYDNWAHRRRPKKSALRIVEIVAAWEP